jgi:hypothetical protein
MRIKIAIATNKNFYEKSVPILLNSLIQCSFPLSDIYIFNAGFENEAYKLLPNQINYWELNHNSFEYSALIHIIEKRIESDYWFLMHDTCQVGLKFKDLLYNIPESNPEKLALRSWPSMSMGSYRFDYLMSAEVQFKLKLIKNHDYSDESIRKWKNWGVPNEDYILWKTEPKPIIYNNCHHDEMRVLNYDNWYGTNTIRRTEYYRSLDLYKNKSNWGQGFGDKMMFKI